MVASAGMFIYLEIADSGCTPVEAFMASIEKTKGQIFMAIAFYFVIGLVAGIGVLACGVGILFTLPLAYCAIAYVYTDITGTGRMIQPAPDTPYGGTPMPPSGPQPPPGQPPQP